MGLETVLERAIRNSNRCVQADRFRFILGISKRKLLPVEIADCGMSLHDNSRLVAVHASDESAFDGADQAVFQLRCVLAEIPDVAILVLGNQSSVSSVNTPSVKTESCTSVQVTPSITLVT